MRANKPRVRLHHVGQATFRLITRDRGYGGPYGQTRWYAKWACIDCHRIVDGTDDEPQWAFETACARNGHSPCYACGKPLPRLNDGCPREHPWRRCPGKTEDDRMMPQHAHKGHLERTSR